jgi:hypothetical protein
MRRRRNPAFESVENESFGYGLDALEADSEGYGPEIEPTPTPEEEPEDFYSWKNQDLFQRSVDDPENQDEYRKDVQALEKEQGYPEEIVPPSPMPAEGRIPQGKEDEDDIAETISGMMDTEDLSEDEMADVVAQMMDDDEVDKGLKATGEYQIADAARGHIGRLSQQAQDVGFNPSEWAEAGKTMLSGATLGMSREAEAAMKAGPAATTDYIGDIVRRIPTKASLPFSLVLKGISSFLNEGGDEKTAQNVINAWQEGKKKTEDFEKKYPDLVPYLENVPALATTMGVYGATEAAAKPLLKLLPKAIQRVTGVALASGVSGVPHTAKKRTEAMMEGKEGPNYVTEFAKDATIGAVTDTLFAGLSKSKEAGKRIFQFLPGEKTKYYAKNFEKIESAMSEKDLMNALEELDSSFQQDIQRGIIKQQEAEKMMEDVVANLQSGSSVSGPAAQRAGQVREEISQKAKAGIGVEEIPKTADEAMNLVESKRGAIAELDEGTRLYNELIDEAKGIAGVQKASLKKKAETDISGKIVQKASEIKEGAISKSSKAAGSLSEEKIVDISKVLESIKSEIPANPTPALEYQLQGVNGLIGHLDGKKFTERQLFEKIKEIEKAYIKDAMPGSKEFELYTKLREGLSNSLKQNKTYADEIGQSAQLMGMLKGTPVRKSNDVLAPARRGIEDIVGVSVGAEVPKGEQLEIIRKRISSLDFDKKESVAELKSLLGEDIAGELQGITRAKSIIENPEAFERFLKYGEDDAVEFLRASSKGQQLLPGAKLTPYGKKVNEAGILKTLTSQIESEKAALSNMEANSNLFERAIKKVKGELGADAKAIEKEVKEMQEIQTQMRSLFNRYEGQKSVTGKGIIESSENSMRRLERLQEAHKLKIIKLFADRDPESLLKISKGISAESKGVSGEEAFNKWINAVDNVNAKRVYDSIGKVQGSAIDQMKQITFSSLKYGSIPATAALLAVMASGTSNKMAYVAIPILAAASTKIGSAAVGKSYHWLAKQAIKNPKIISEIANAVRSGEFAIIPTMKVSRENK